jgi:type I restriction enzyme S subunit
MNKDEYRSIRFPLAPLAEQQGIVEEIERHFSIIDETERTVERCQEQARLLKSSILKITFEGKLVPQDLSEEPAEKLLERIKAERAKSKAEKDTNKKKNTLRQLELSTYVK